MSYPTDEQIAEIYDLAASLNYTREDILRLVTSIGKLCAAARDRNRLEAVNRELVEAAKEVLAAMIDDFGDPDDQMGDLGCVGGGLKEDGSPDPMAITFAHMIHLRTALRNAEQGGGE